MKATPLIVLLALGGSVAAVSECRSETSLCPKPMVMTRDGCKRFGTPYIPSPPARAAPSEASPPSAASPPPVATKESAAEAATPAPRRPDLDATKPMFVAKGRVLCGEAAVGDAFLEGHLKGGDRSANQAIISLFLFPTKDSGCIRTFEREQVSLADEPLSPGKLIKIRDHQGYVWYALPTDVEN
jgi:hypothetical protein